MQRTYLSLNHPEHSDFISDQWGLPILVYCAYRFVTAGVLLSWIVLSGYWEFSGDVDDSHRSKQWFLYLTNWCFLLLCLTNIYHLILVVYHKTKGGRLRNHWYYITPFQLKILWVMSNISNAGAFIVLLLFWSLSYRGGYVKVVDIVTHAMNAIYVIVDLFLVANPVRWQHFYQSSIFSTFYIVFSVIYEHYGIKDEKAIYQYIDWQLPAIAALLSLLVIFLVAPISHLIGFAVYKIRMAIYKHLYGQESRGDTESLLIPWYLTGRRYRNEDASNALPTEKSTEDVDNDTPPRYGSF